MTLRVARLLLLALWISHPLPQVYASLPCQVGGKYYHARAFATGLCKSNAILSRQECADVALSKDCQAKLLPKPRILGGTSGRLDMFC